MTALTTTKPKRDLEAFPAHVIGVPGVLGDMIRWTEACSIRSAPVLSLGACIGAFSTVMGRWYKTRTGLRANLYLVGLARSGAGKENGRSCAMTMLSRSGLSSMRGTDDVASSAGLLRVIGDFPVRLFCLDEIGLMLGNVTSNKAGTHERDILSVLMRLHSCAGTLWAGKAYAEKDAKPIEQPHACVWGTSTPERFWSALSGSHTIDGFLNRLLVLPLDGEIPSLRDPTADPSTPPADILEALQRIGSGEALQRNGGNLEAMITRSTRTESYQVPQTDEATRLLAEAAERQRWQQNNSPCPEAWTRALEMVQKLSLVAAVSERPEAPAIDAQHVRWAGYIAWWSIRRSASAAEERVGDTDEQRATRAILGAVRRASATGQGLTLAGLTKTCWRFDRRQRDAGLRNLLDGGQVIEETEIRRGKTVKVFGIATENELDYHSTTTELLG